jgi:large repetitive protein
VLVTVYPKPVPVISVAGDTIFCEGDSVLLSSSIAETYLWNTGDTTQSIYVSITGNYWVMVTDTNNCEGTSEAVEILVLPNPVPVISETGDLVFCPGDSVILTSSSADAYLWSTGDTTQSITVLSSGNYYVETTYVNGCSNISEITEVIVHSNPVTSIIASGPKTFCLGDSVVLTSSFASSYEWNTGDTTKSITVYSTGNYYVIGTYSGGCSSTSDTASIIVKPLPIATITPGGSTEFCENGSVVLNSSSGLTYLWNTGATSQAINVFSSGAFTVTVKGANGCSARSDTTYVNVKSAPVPVISASGSTNICPTGSVELTSTVGASYLWSNGATTQSINVSTGGSYFVTVTYSNGCSKSSASTLVTVLSNPPTTITPGGPINLCDGDSIVLSSSSASAYLWNTGDTTKSIVVKTSGNYSVTATYSGGCTNTSSNVNVTIKSNPISDITANGPTEFCPGGSVTLTASTAYSYLWSNGATTQSIIVSTGGSYTVQVSNSNGCSATSAAMIITVNPLPDAEITANGPLAFCVGDSVTLTASMASSYLWNTGATTQSITVKVGGNYKVTVMNSGGCSSTSAITKVTVNPLPNAFITASGSINFCIGDSVYLTASTGNTYLWNTGETTKSIYVKEAGQYYVTVTSVHGCSNTSSLIEVSPTIVTVDIGSDTLLCDECILLDAGNQGAYFYKWSNGSEYQTLLACTSGKYWVEVTDAIGCIGSDTINVSIYPKPIVNLGPDITLGPGSSIYLNAGNTGADYIWNTGETTQTIIVDSTGFYWVSVTNAYGCSESDSVNVTVFTGLDELAGGPLEILVYPNPARNFINLSIENSLSGNYQISIFSSLGTLLFHKTYTNGNLNEQLNIQDLPPGIYFLQVISDKQKKILKISKN